MSTVEKNVTSAAATHLRASFFLILTPFYLWLVFAKLSVGADFEGILSISIIILVLYLPIQLTVKQYDIPLTFTEVFKHEEILKLIYPLFGMLILTALFTFGKEIKMKNEYLMVIALIAYGLWWFLTSRLLTLIKHGDDETQLKMLGMFFFVIAIALISNFPKLPDSIDFWYFIAVALTALKVLLFTLMLVPQYGIKVVGFLAKDALKSVFGGSTRSKKQSNIDVADAFEGSVGAVFMMMVLFVVIFVPFINWVTSITDSWNSQIIAILITILMIAISAFGAYFQIRLFISYFVKEKLKAQRVTTTFLSLFYLAAIINMGVTGTVDHRTKQLESTQKGIHNFNDKMHELDSKLLTR